MHCAAVAVDGESRDNVLSATPQSSLSAEMMVAEVRRAQAAARSAEDAKDWTLMPLVNKDLFEATRGQSTPSCERMRDC